MKTIESSIFLVLAVILSMSSLAQSFDANSPSAVSPAATPQQIPSMVYMGAPAGNQQMHVAPANAVPNFGDGANSSLRVKIFRAEELSVSNSRSNMFFRGDRAAFTVNAPTSTVNGALSLVGTVNQAPLDSTATRLIQVLSLMATRKMNAEFAYSARVSKNSSFDSVISCNLHPDTGSGRADVAARIQYGVKF